MQPVVVYDTNILFSSILWSSKPNRCIELARQNIVKGLTCQEIIEELVEILRTKAKFSPSQLTDTTEELLSFLRLVKITNTLKVVEVDPDDDKVIECAVVGSATHIIAAIYCRLEATKASLSSQLQTSSDKFFNMNSLKMQGACRRLAESPSPFVSVLPFYSYGVGFHGSRSTQPTSPPSSKNRSDLPQ